MLRCLLLALTSAVLLLAGGCGRRGPAVDPAPFEQAVSDYLRLRSMDLRVREFKELRLENGTATAQVALSAADEGVAQVQVRWSFTFARQADGAWKVTGHQQ